MNHHRLGFSLLAIALIALSIAAFAPLTAAAAEGPRMALLQLGGGLAIPVYPADLETAISEAESQPGVNRITLSLDLGLGIAVSQEAYLMGRIDGCGDRLYDSSGYLQLNMYLFSLGVRYYPMVTGLYIEGAGGASRGVLDTSVGTTVSPDFGFGYGVALGYDFTRSVRGFGLLLEARYLGLTIESEQAGCVMLTVDLCWK
jgi:hypothetical protein